MIKALIFDLDGLIVDTEQAEYDAWLAIFQGYGFELPVAEYAVVIGRGVGTIAERPEDMLESRLGHAVDREKIFTRHRRLVQELLEGAKPMPGVESLIQQAKARGLKVGVASSSPYSWVGGWLEKLGLLGEMQTVKTSDDVTRAKPDPELYLAAAEALGVQPREAIAFEDSANGLAAAKAAGLWCVATPNAMTAHMDLSAADLRVGSLVDVDLEELLRLGNPSVTL